jgi:hypothetical protein
MVAPVSASVLNFTQPVEGADAVATHFSELTAAKVASAQIYFKTGLLISSVH